MGTELRRIAWARWQVIGQVYGDFQARAMAVLFYFTFFVPFALVAMLTGDPLQLRKPPSGWLKKGPVGQTLEEARRQF